LTKPSLFGRIPSGRRRPWQLPPSWYAKGRHQKYITNLHFSDVGRRKHPGDHEIGENMTQIEITRDVVRNLATTLSKIDTRGIKHTDRLALIAGAFGMRSDAFMHALKSMSGAETAKNAGPARNLFDAPLRPHLEDLGITDVKKWQKILSSPSGVCFVCGPTMSGRTTTFESSARYLRESGRPMYVSAPLSVIGSGVVIYGDVVSAKDMDAVFTSAGQGHLVVAVLHENGAAGVLQRVIDLGCGGHIQSVRGVIKQVVVRKRCGNCVGGKQCFVCNGEGYSGRTLISHVVNFDGVCEPFGHAQESDLNGYFEDVILRLRQDILDFPEMERALGLDSKNIEKNFGKARLSQILKYKPQA
jgi:hypothetical protein